MSFLEKIEPHLVSEDRLVQNFVLFVLDNYYPFVPSEWTDRLLKDALQSKEKESNILLHLDKLPFGEKSVEILIDALKKSNLSNKHFYLPLIEKLEPELAWKYRQELEPYTQKGIWDFYRTLLEGTEEDVWEAYREVLALLEKEQNHNHHLYSQAKILVKTLVKKGWTGETEIDLTLNEQLAEDYFSYSGILSVYMIGLLKLPKYIPLLVSFLDRDEDILLEETTDALISFQSDEVLELVIPYAKMQESSIFAMSVLSGTKTPFATQVLRELMDEVGDEDEQSIVFEALCHQLSTEALPEIEAYLKDHPHSFLVDVEETAYGFYKVMGMNHPDLEEWKRIAEGQDLRNEMEVGGGGASTEKVGRNDPCPCGSGKKYKKCCGG
ncbi:MAG TPA: SEC-C metal-binding domain-containing protein [Pseudoneobacillus sp.]|nr:SEC-C metal-binding domain-containing protein [Pseudoneobacillus sp.]